MKTTAASFSSPAAYIDTLVNLHFPEGARKLNQEEIVGLSFEFLDAGSESTALEWIMVNLAKHQDIQLKLFNEIKGVIMASSDGSVQAHASEIINEEDLKMMAYLRL
ncbi:hypothetical protein IFM89_020896 [Coptis chinensis]|uniref:Uncharacterized protein n=1 Tax=Coptis chinensis TaxID=261450 RepID=A0A835I9H4_9MAGN|nr:hypothetical protein IFM89_020896 [Coptis chinensis]